MKQTTRQMAIVVAGLAVLCSARLSLADDLMPPCWRGRVGTTFQLWNFSTNANPATPEQASNGNGTPQATISLGPGGAGWINTFSFLGTNQGIWGNPVRLKQAVVNLLDNAIKYTPEKGTVQLRVFAANGHAMLEVEDNGIGIPPDALPHVFDRFFRVDKARSAESESAGLGLSIVKSICTAHGADVEAQSNVGRGSCFRVRLPLFKDRKLFNNS